jgi:hypothetical protein
MPKETRLRRSIAASAGHEKKSAKQRATIRQLEALALARKTLSCYQDPRGQDCGALSRRPKGRLPP